MPSYAEFVQVVHYMILFRDTAWFLLFREIKHLFRIFPQISTLDVTIRTDDKDWWKWRWQLIIRRGEEESGHWYWHQRSPTVIWILRTSKSSAITIMDGDHLNILKKFCSSNSASQFFSSTCTFVDYKDPDTHLMPLWRRRKKAKAGSPRQIFALRLSSFVLLKIYFVRYWCVDIVQCIVVSFF